ncbi:MAG: hypothetical protein AUK47_10775 [Deltaproteobacteria bacterium CG2_30_63_29]|nr:MAG: hypothetical protein AUK47_10775 [Deltaproteobacteria bacterium CG2_30_63_29]PJB48152.1 MAG: hypothetical protein CO108_02960 [Deltaproteobacteria bacterium CG_4_9_14_3_um_filter_63_12]
MTQGRRFSLFLLVWIGLAWFPVSLWAADPVGPSAESPYRLELSVVTGWGITMRPLDVIDNGVLLGAGVRFDSPYFVSPSFDFAFVRLAQSQDVVDLGELGGRQTVSSAIRALSFLFGGSVEFWDVLRLGAGIGLYVITVHSTVLGETITPTEVSSGLTADVDVVILRAKWLSMSLQARSMFMSDEEFANHSLSLVTSFAIDL